MSEGSFEELLNNSMKEVNIEKTVTGKVIDITSKDEIIVDLGYKADGIIPKSEYSFNENDNPRDEIKIGDTITADVLKMNDGVGNVLLSCKKYKARGAKSELEQKFKDNEIMEGKISEVIDKGFIVNYKGIRVFIPISLSGITRSENVEDYKNKQIQFKLIECDLKNRRIIGSIKIIKDEKIKKESEEFWNNAEVDKEYEGKVTSISVYGAFIDIGVVQGLLHISEMTWDKNKSPNDILKVGQIIKVKAIDVDKENKRIKLSYLEKGPNPWEMIKEKYNINDIVTIKVVKLMPFGAFVELETGIEGLVHISQISEKRITKPEEELKIGQKANAKILNIDFENRKIELTIKELEGTSNEYKEEI